MPQLLPENLREGETDRQTEGACSEQESGGPGPPPSPVLDAQDELVEAVHVLEAGLVCDRVDDEEAVPRAHVLLPHGAELLLPGRVQNWGGMRPLRGCHHPPWSSPSLQTPTLLLLSRLWLALSCPHKRPLELPGLCWKRPQGQALTDLFVDVPIPTHGASWALILCLEKSFFKSVVDSAIKPRRSPQTWALDPCCSPYNGVGGQLPDSLSPTSSSVKWKPCLHLVGPREEGESTRTCLGAALKRPSWPGRVLRPCVDRQQAAMGKEWPPESQGHSLRRMGLSQWWREGKLGLAEGCWEEPSQHRLSPTPSSPPTAPPCELLKPTCLQLPSC